MAEEEQKYHMRYWIKPEPEGFGKNEVEEGEGACDDIVLHSIIRPKGGGISCMVVSGNGRTGESISPNDLFQVWALWAHSLMEHPDLSDNRKQICAFVHETVKGAVLAARTAEEGKS